MILSKANGCEPFAWVPRGVYIGLPPGDTMVIQLGAGPSRLFHRPPSSLPTGGACRLAGPAGESGTVAVILMTQAWSLGRGNSATVYRAITVVTSRLVWLMTRGPRGSGRPTLGSRLPRGRLRGVSAAFYALTDWRVRRLRALQVGHHGHSAPHIVAEVRAGMATVPGHAGDLQRYDTL